MTTNIVVVGGGPAGLATVRSLAASGRTDLAVHLVDQDQSFTFTPDLYRVALGANASHTCLLLALLAKKFGARFTQSRVDGIHHSTKRVLLADGQKIGYDQLVISSGLHGHYPNLPGVKDYGYKLESMADGWLLRNHLETMATRFAQGEDSPSRWQIIILGGGSAGVELAGHLAHWRQQNKLLSKMVQIELVEQGPEILPGFSASVRQAASRDLTRQQVAILTDTIFTPARARAIFSQQDPTSHKTLIWAGGFTHEPVTTKTQLHRQRQQLVVDPYLRILDQPDVWASGAAALSGQPMTIQQAIAQGETVADNLLRHVDGRPLVMYESRLSQPALALSSVQAVVSLSPVALTGRVGRLVKSLLDIRTLSRVLPWGEVLKWQMTGAEMCVACQPYRYVAGTQSVL